MCGPEIGLYLIDELLVAAELVGRNRTVGVLAEITVVLAAIFPD
jgi:hypothetical protein